MKIDTHTHTKEGSIDSIASINKTIEILKEKEYDGMIVTDHNSYEGYKKISNNVKDFVVIKGIEYDTKDAGHMIIILPTDKDVDIFTYKGMGVKDTIKIVKNLGGIIGPAHPFDFSRLGMFNNIKWLTNPEIIREFDFIEGFNSCGSVLGNHQSKLLAKKFNKPMFGGSDSHKLISVGKAHTILPEKINNEDELIELTKTLKYGDTNVNGDYYNGALHSKLGFVYKAALGTFCIFSLISGHFSAKKAIAEAIALSLV